MNKHANVDDGFFRNFDRFTETSSVAAGMQRLNFRHHMIIEQNTDVIKGARIFEIGSHDGRWSFAALKAGAAHVHGVEPRQRLVDEAVTSMQTYGVSKDSYRFDVRDGFNVIDEQIMAGASYDCALVLGFFYHTMRHYELLEKLRKLQCKSIIVDTTVMQNTAGRLIELKSERSSSEANAHSDKAFELIGVPSIAAVHQMLSMAGYRSEQISPKRWIPAGQCWDYDKGFRVVIVGRRPA